MTICLTGFSALEYLAYHRLCVAEHAKLSAITDCGPAPALSAVDGRSVRLEAPSDAELTTYLRRLPPTMPDRTDVLVLDAADRRNSQIKKCHVLPDTIRQGAVRRTPDGPLVTCIECTLIQVAPSLSKVELIRLLCGACGAYARQNVRTPYSLSDATSQVRQDDGKPTRHPLIEAEPMTSPEAIKRFIGRLSEGTGQEKGRRLPPGATKILGVLPHVITNAASPREIVLTLLLCLPTSMGGYGLPKPQLNTIIKHDARMCRLDHRMWFKPDLYWETAHLDVEYDSIQEHAGAEQMARDALRRNMILAQGVTVFSATNDHIIHLEILDRLAKDIARELGFRHRINRVSNWPDRQRALHKALTRPEGRIYL